MWVKLYWSKEMIPGRLQFHEQFECRGCKNIYHASNNCKKSGMAILLSDKIDLKTKLLPEIEWHFIMIKMSIH